MNQHAWPQVRVVYRLTHQFLRRRLNAGGLLKVQSFDHPGVRAAMVAVVASGRQPASVFDHALHYHCTYERRAKATGSAA